MTNTSIFVPVVDQPVADQWTDFTVLYACVSVGNVPQLAVDLLVSTLMEARDCRFVGHIYSPALMPLSGPDPYRFGGNSLATSCQVYESVGRKILLIQQRTPLYKELRKEFYESFSLWLSAYRFTRVVVLTSSFIEHLVSALDSGDSYPVKYLKNESYTLDDRYLTENIKSVERVDAFTLQPSAHGVLHLPGSGWAKDLIKYMDKYKIPAIGLVLYCSEGDNRPHSHALASTINRWLNLIDFGNSTIKIKSWIIPFSWRHMFGDEPPESIF